MDLAEGLNRLRRQHVGCKSVTISCVLPCDCGADEANALIDALLAEHAPVTRRNYPPTHPRAGSNKARQEVGDPGHCERCAEVGHVKAHPSLGCGDVGCTAAHGPDDETESAAPDTEGAMNP